MANEYSSGKAYRKSIRLKIFPGNCATTKHLLFPLDKIYLIILLG